MMQIKLVIKHFLYEMLWTTAVGGIAIVVAAVAVVTVYNLWMFYFGTIVLGGTP